MRSKKKIKQSKMDLELEDIPDEKLKDHIELLRLKLLEMVSIHGISSKEVINFSQHLDKFIVRYQRIH